MARAGIPNRAQAPAYRKKTPRPRQTRGRDVARSRSRGDSTAAGPIPAELRNRPDGSKQPLSGGLAGLNSTRLRLPWSLKGRARRGPHTLLSLLIGRCSGWNQSRMTAPDSEPRNAMFAGRRKENYGRSLTARGSNDRLFADRTTPPGIHDPARMIARASRKMRHRIPHHASHPDLATGPHV